MTPILAPQPPVLAAIAGDAAHGFPVRRLFCIGRNYADHAREMGKDPTREPPFFFTKWAETVVPSGTAIVYPPETKSLHHEVELVVAIGREGFRVSVADAPSLVWGYAVGLDMTRRDLQNQAKKTGRPWEIGKMVEKSAPMTPIVLADKIGHPKKGHIWLDVNGTRKQDSDIDQMIWDVPNQIAFLSQLWTLKAGDIIMTGTPAGVGPCKKGDVLKGGVDGVGTIEVVIT